MHVPESNFGHAFFRNNNECDALRRLVDSPLNLQGVELERSLCRICAPIACIYFDQIDGRGATELREYPNGQKVLKRLWRHLENC